MRVYGVKRGHHAAEWYVILTSEGGTTTYDYVHTTNRRVNAERMARRLNAQANDER
jgi:hypothetical protein